MSKINQLVMETFKAEFTAYNKGGYKEEGEPKSNRGDEALSLGNIKLYADESSPSMHGGEDVITAPKHGDSDAAVMSNIKNKYGSTVLEAESKIDKEIEKNEKELDVDVDADDAKLLKTIESKMKKMKNEDGSLNTDAENMSGRTGFSGND